MLEWRNFLQRTASIFHTPLNQYSAYIAGHVVSSFGWFIYSHSLFHMKTVRKNVIGRGTKISPLATRHGRTSIYLLLNPRNGRNECQCSVSTFFLHFRFARGGERKRYAPRDAPRKGWKRNEPVQQTVPSSISTHHCAARKSASGGLLPAASRAAQSKARFIPLPEQEATATTTLHIKGRKTTEQLKKRVRERQWEEKTATKLDKRQPTVTSKLVAHFHS